MNFDLLLIIKQNFVQFENASVQLSMRIVVKISANTYVIIKFLRHAIECAIRFNNNIYP